MDPAKKKTRTSAWLLVAVFFIGIAMMMALHQQLPGEASSGSAIAAAPAAAKTPAAQARDDAKTAKLRAAGAGAMTLKRAAKDPETFEMKSVVLMNNGTTCYEYRAKNSFGAVLPGEAVLTSKGKLLVHEQAAKAFVAAWNKDCTPAGGDEILPLLLRLDIL